MDGNGRWAQQRGLSRSRGHKAGIERTRDIVRLCGKKAISALTLFAFSTENWQRPRTEVAFLMQMFLQTIGGKDTRELMENNVQFHVIGERNALNKTLSNKFAKLEFKTINNTGLKLNIAINYSGRWDIVNAARKLGEQIAAGLLQPQDISLQKFQEYICLAELPEPDLLIRTSGEMRISNFMLWQLAYTEFYFTDVLWPDFDEVELDKALIAYAQRERRFGTVKNML